MPTISLGGIAFDPGPRREIRFGGIQALVKQDVPGAGPHYQDMGSDEEPISWNGVLTGANAVEIARAVETMRTAGQPVDLVTSVAPLIRVRVRSFEYRVLRKDRVEYDISLVREGTTPDFTPPPEATDTEAAAATPATGTHVVVAGDTLYALAQRYLGNGALWPAIATANGITDPGGLQVGRTLTVPIASEASALAAAYQGRVTVQNSYLQEIMDYRKGERMEGGASG